MYYMDLPICIWDLRYCISVPVGSTIYGYAYTLAPNSPHWMRPLAALSCFPDANWPPLSSEPPSLGTPGATSELKFQPL